MKLHTKNGSLSYEDYEILPAIENTEFEVEEDDIKKTKVDIVSPGWGRDGKFVKITTTVKVTRFYPVDNQ